MHLFIAGGYSTQCPTYDKFDERCNDPEHRIMYDTQTYTYSFNAALPRGGQSGRRRLRHHWTATGVFLFGGFDKVSASLSDSISKYLLHYDAFAPTVQSMGYTRSQLNVVVLQERAGLSHRSAGQRAGEHAAGASLRHGGRRPA